MAAWLTAQLKGHKFLGECVHQICGKQQVQCNFTKKKENMISSRREMGDCANSAGAGAREKEIRLFYLGKKEECCW